MLQVKLIIEIEEEFVKMGYGYGVENFLAGCKHDTEPFVRMRDHVHFLKDQGKLKSWKCNKFDNWTETKKHVRQE